MASDPKQGGHATIILLRSGERIRVRYTNWRGVQAIRNIELDGAPHWGRTEWHPEPQWLIAGTDTDNGQHRMWAVKDMEPVL
jgi:hypothetical protein